MDGDGGESVERQHVDRVSRTFELPSVLADLDSSDRTTQAAAIDAIRSRLEACVSGTLDEQTLSTTADAKADAGVISQETTGDGTTGDDTTGDGTTGDGTTLQTSNNCKIVVPTVPKLRSLLVADEFDEYDDDIAFCLAEIAAISPDDVAPSVEPILDYVRTNPDSQATNHLVRGLSQLARDRPDALIDHVEVVNEILELRTGYRQWDVTLVARLSTSIPSAIEHSVEILIGALSADPETHADVALSALGRLAQVDDAIDLSFVDTAVEFVADEAADRRNAALKCLADVAKTNPTCVAENTSKLIRALDHHDRTTRRYGVLALARIAKENAGPIDVERNRLRRLLRDDDASIRATTCELIGHATLDVTTNRLGRIANEDPDRTVRDRASWAKAQLESEILVGDS